VRDKLARIDELVSHPERIRDAGELAALLIHSKLLSAIADRAMLTVERKSGEPVTAIAKAPHHRPIWH